MAGPKILRADSQAAVAACRRDEDMNVFEIGNDYDSTKDPSISRPHMHQRRARGIYPEKIDFLHSLGWIDFFALGVLFVCIGGLHSG